MQELIRERDDYKKVLQELTKAYNSSDDKMWWVRICRRVLKRHRQLKHPRLTFKQQILDPLRKKKIENRGL